MSFISQPDDKDIGTNCIKAIMLEHLRSRKTRKKCTNTTKIRTLLPRISNVRYVPREQRITKIIFFFYVSIKRST